MARPIKKPFHYRHTLSTILYAVRLYQHTGLSYRDVAAYMSGKKNVRVTHKTVYEWVQKFGDGKEFPG